VLDWRHDPCSKGCLGVALALLRRLWFPVLFVLVYSSAPTYADAFYTFLLDTFPLADWQFSLQNFAGLLGSLLAAAAYNQWCTRYQLWRVFLLAALLDLLANASCLLLVLRLNERWLHVPDDVYIPLDALVVSHRPRALRPPRCTSVTIHLNLNGLLKMLCNP